jgi:ornithine cyclodeaminase/alanine dehydrogenase-like protein (mu-crystallin family)
MAKDIEFLYLSKADVVDTGVTMQTAMAAVEDAFILHHHDKVLLPYKTVLDMGERERGRCNAMPAFVGGDYNVFGIKWIAGFPQNPFLHGLPRATGFLILNDANKGIPLAIMDCTFLSAMRTGAVTGVGAKYLARKDSEVVAMIGTGVQARTQLEALLAVLPGLKEVRGYDLRKEASEVFAGEMADKYGITARSVDTAETAVRDADIVITVTMADEPIVKDAWMKPGSFFSAVGSYQEEEFDVVLHSDKVVVDSLVHVMHRETPVVALMVTRGLISETDVIDIGAILCGEQPGRETPQERIFFSPIGMSTEDICLTKRVYDLAIEKSIGQKLNLWGNN